MNAQPIIDNRPQLIKVVKDLCGQLSSVKVELSRLRAMNDLASRVPIYATNAERDAAIPNPVNGNICYNTATGAIEGYEAGAWVNL